MRFFLAFLLFLFLPSLAHAQTTNFAKSGNWTINHYGSNNSCEAFSNGANAYLTFAVRPDGSRNFYFTSKKLSWVDKDKSYKVKISTDKYYWNGTLSAYRSDDGTGTLYMTAVKAEFFSDLKRSNRLRLDVDGATYGPMSLKGSSRAIEILMACADAAKAGAFAPPKPIELPYATLSNWDGDSLGKSFAIYDWTLRVEREENLDGSADVYLISSHKKGPERTIKLEDSSFPSGAWGVFPFEYNNEALYFTSFTGGAHCCTKAVLLTPEGKQIDVGTFDGEGPAIKDLDHDGDYEFLTYDHRFLYAFASYAESFGPLEILRFDGRELRDATLDPKFSNFLMRDFIGDLQQISNDEDSRKSQGIVGGVLAKAAQLGMYQAVRPDFDDLLSKLSPDWDLSCSPPTCDQKTVFKTFEEALTFWLNRWGYDTNDGLSEDALDYFEVLASLGPEKSSEGAEAACGDASFEFVVDRQNRIARSMGWEHRCTVTNATVLGDSALAHALCWGEGMVWSEFQQLEHDGEKLYMTSWDQSPTSVFRQFGDKAKPRKICR